MGQRLRLIMTKTYLITMITMRVSIPFHESNCAISKVERELTIIREHFQKNTTTDLGFWLNLRWKGDDSGPGCPTNPLKPSLSNTA